MSRESQQAREDRLSMCAEENDQFRQAIKEAARFRTALLRIGALTPPGKVHDIACEALDMEVPPSDGEAYR